MVDSAIIGDRADARAAMPEFLDTEWLRVAQSQHAPPNPVQQMSEEKSR